MFVIGIAGQAQMGKDCTADRLALRLNKQHNDTVDIFKASLGVSPSIEDQERIPEYDLWRRTAFASNVKKVYCDTFDVDLDFIEKWKTNPEPPPGFDMPVRQSLQFIGDGFRKILSSIWLDLAFRDKKPSIISDVRYVNEFTRVKTEGGLNVLVGRPEKLNDDPNGSEAQIRPYIDWCFRAFAPSAKFVNLRDVDYAAIKGVLGDDSQPPPGMEMFDVFIRNDGTIDELYEIVDNKLVPFVHGFVFEYKG